MCLYTLHCRISSIHFQFCCCEIYKNSDDNAPSLSKIKTSPFWPHWFRLFSITIKRKLVKRNAYFSYLFQHLQSFPDFLRPKRKSQDISYHYQVILKETKNRKIWKFIANFFFLAFFEQFFFFFLTRIDYLHWLL